GQLDTPDTHFPIVTLSPHPVGAHHPSYFDGGPVVVREHIPTVSGRYDIEIVAKHFEREVFR
ncbi:hypothetical protein, partial [Nocardia cyriacigeorgica]|uniref:hypothetical protein n=1 Tax=Nocardia cyriacigeorgica TaxID=135487 RepID=UPI002458E873